MHLTAYCPDDELGLLACDYLLARAAELLDGTSEAELRRWLIERDPEIAELFAKLDAGWKLPKSGDFTVDPSNAPAEARIIRHLLRERIEQCAGRPGRDACDVQRAHGRSPRHNLAPWRQQIGLF